MSELLPPGWAKTQLEVIVDILDSLRIPLNSDERAKRIEGKSKSDLIPYYGATGQAGYVDAHLFDEPLILLGEDGVPFYDLFKQKAYRVSGKSWVNNHAHVLREKRGFTDDRYVEAFLNSFNYTGYVSGTTRLKLTQASMKEIPIPLAPFPEQKRIADKLDTVLARVDACRERLNRVPLILKRFRQSVLAAATSGQLTADWRVAHRMNAGEFNNFYWTENKLIDLCQKDRALTYGVIKLGDEIPNGVPCLRTSNVRWLRVETDGMKRIAANLSAEYSRTVLQGNEVLVNVRGTLGGVAAVKPEMKGWNVSREVAVVPVEITKATAAYLALWIASDTSQRWLSKAEKGVAYVGINIEDLRNLPVLLPLIDEQNEIVHRVETLFAFADRLEARLATARTAIDRLTPALLAKAFRGELVPQDPNDEPAAELLKHLAAARTATSDKPRRGRAAKVEKRPSGHPSQVCDS